MSLFPYMEMAAGLNVLKGLKMGVSLSSSLEPRALLSRCVENTIDGNVGMCWSPYKEKRAALIGCV